LGVAERVDGFAALEALEVTSAHLHEIDVVG
jgi:hypothetical protein